MNAAVTAIAGGRGGTGKSTLTVCLGKILAGRGNKTVLVDLNLGMRALDVLTGLENGVVLTITDALREGTSPEEVLLPCPDVPNLYLLPASQTKALSDIPDGDLKALFDRLRGSADQILIDTAPGIGEDLRRSLRPADKALIITTPDTISVRNCDRLRRIWEEEGKSFNDCFLLANRLKEYPEGFGPADLKELLPIAPAGFLPEEEFSGLLPFQEKGTGRTRLFGVCDRLLGTAAPGEPDDSLPARENNVLPESSGKDEGFYRKLKKRFEKG